MSDPYQTTPEASEAAAARDDIEINTTEPDDPKQSKFYCPPGKRAMRVTDVIRKDSSKGKDQLTWNFEVMGNPDEGGGKKLRTWTGLGADAIWSLKRMLRALGAPERIKISEIPSFANGRRVLGTVVDDVYQGRLGSKLKTIEEHPDGPVITGP